MDTLKYVYVVNEQSYDDYPGQGVCAVFTTKETVKRAYPKVRWEWYEGPPYDGCLAATERNGGDNPYFIYYLPLDEIPDFRTGEQKWLDEQVEKVDTWLKVEGITAERYGFEHEFLSEGAIADCYALSYKVTKGKRGFNKITDDLQAPDGFTIMLHEEYTRPPEAASPWAPEGTFRYFTLRTGIPPKSR